MNFKTCKAGEVSWLTNFYNKVEYTGTFKDEDDLYFVETDDSVVGVVRIALENGDHVLRGMYMLEEHRGRGIGTNLLNYLNSKIVGNTIFCIPYAHLVNFYGRIGFKVIDKISAPEFLVSRLNEYRGRNMDVVLMMREAIPK